MENARIAKPMTCCPWSHGLRPKKLEASVAVPPAPVRVPSQRQLAQSVASVTSVANDKCDPGGYAQISNVLQTKRTLKNRKISPETSRRHRSMLNL